MSKSWIPLVLLLLLLLPLLSQAADAGRDEIDTNLQHLDPEGGYPDSDGIRRFECPTGFFRLRRNCYYLSGGTAPWREAYFHCAARNATLAVLNRRSKDEILRTYLRGEQFRKLERWIGGIYNWLKKNWEWGVSGDKVRFQNFGNLDTSISKNYAWHCLVLDPTQQYKWTARSCLEHKYYICEVPAGRIGKSRRRKNISDPLAPQNQRLRPTSHAEKMEQNQRKRKNKLKSMRKKNWQHIQHEDNQVWAHGIKPGSRPPKGSNRTVVKHQKLGRIKGPRHGRKQQRQQHKASPQLTISQVTPAPGEYGAFPADGRAKPDEQQLQSLGNVEVPFPRLFGNDFMREEILLKI